MLVLTRKVGESIVIGDGITVRVLEVGGRVRLGIEAPRDVSITRPDAAAKPAAPARAGRVADRMRSRSQQPAFAATAPQAPVRKGRTRTGVSANAMLE